MTTATLSRKPAATPTPAIPRPRRSPENTPECGTWVIDPARAVVAFSGKASFLAPTISARFTGVDGKVEVAELAPGAVVSGAVQVTVDVTTMTTGNPVYDELIKAADPFDTRRFPIAVYRSTGVSWSDGQLTVEGSLTLRGVTKQVPLQASYVVGRSGDRMIVRAAGAVDRSAFGISFDVPGCGKLIPKVMKLEIDVDVTRT